MPPFVIMVKQYLDFCRDTLRDLGQSLRQVSKYRRIYCERGRKGLRHSMGTAQRLHALRIHEPVSAIPQLDQRPEPYADTWMHRDLGDFGLSISFMYVLISSSIPTIHDPEALALSDSIIQPCCYK
mgnify:FL=1